MTLVAKGQKERNEAVADSLREMKRSFEDVMTKQSILIRTVGRSLEQSRVL